MKIMLLANTFGALANFRYELIMLLLKRGDEVILGFPLGKDVQEQDEKYKKEFEQYGCRFIDTPMDRKGKSLIQDCKLFLKYKGILTKEKPDAVLTYTIKPNIYATIAASKKIQVFMTVTGIGNAIECGNMLSKVLTIFYKVAMKKCTKVFFQNRENYERFQLPKEKCNIVPGSGVNLEKFKLLEYPSGEKIQFLLVSRIMKEKGIDQYLEAAKRIKKKYPKTEFHVVGACDDKTYLEKLRVFEKEGIIAYHGQKKNIVDFYEMSSCTIHPTYYPEGMSNVLLESAACGRPLIATDRSGCREIIDDGVNGFICKQKDTQDLVKQIEKFLALNWEQRRDMGLAGRAKVEREFDRQIVVDAYLQELR